MIQIKMYFKILDFKSIPHNHSIHRISLESIVKLVSDFRKPTNTSTGHFHLKNAFLSSYNPYFYHYSRYLVSQAEQHQKKERANLSREMKVLILFATNSFLMVLLIFLNINERVCILFCFLILLLRIRFIKYTNFIEDREN